MSDFPGAELYGAKPQPSEKRQNPSRRMATRSAKPETIGDPPIRRIPEIEVGDEVLCSACDAPVANYAVVPVRVVAIEDLGPLFTGTAPRIEVEGVSGHHLGVRWKTPITNADRNGSCYYYRQRAMRDEIMGGDG